MRNLRTSAHINSSPVDVFHVLTDFQSYADWNPWLKDIAVSANEVKVGDVISTRLNARGLFGLRLTYRVERMRSPDTLLLREESWFKIVLGIKREYQILTRSKGTAIYSTGLQVQGPLAALTKIFGNRFIHRALKKEAHALKKYCEAHYPLSKS